MSNETKQDVFKIAIKFAAKSGWLDYDDMINRYDDALPDDLQVISASVAAFIVWCKGQNTPLQDALYFESDGFMYTKQDEERIGGWIANHQDEFARAWLDGYQVEEDE